MPANMNAVLEGLTTPEISEARDYLENTRDAVFAATQGLSEAQWNYRPASDGWSIAEIVEHIVIVQERILGPGSQMLAEAPEGSSDDTQIIDDIVKVAIPDRSRKFKAPEFVQPSGQWTPAESLSKFSVNTARLIERLESTPGLRQHRIPSPPLNAVTDGKYQLMDGYQWILAAAGHTKRHTRQIVEVKAEPNFPTR